LTRTELLHHLQRTKGVTEAITESKSLLASMSRPTGNQCRDTLKILVLSGQFPTPRDPICGTFVVEQMKALRKLGAEMSVITAVPWAPRWLKFIKRIRKHLNTPRQARIENFQVQYPRVPVLPGDKLFFLSGVLLFLRYVPMIRKQLKQGTIDLIHAHTIMPDGFAATLLGQTFNIPVVCTVHGSDVKIYPRTNWMTRRSTQWALKRVNRLIVVSQDLQKAVTQLVGSRQVCIARNGADPLRFRSTSRKQVRSQLELPADKPLLLFVGNLFPVKGVEYLLRAMVTLDQDLSLYLLGDGYLKEELIELSRQLGVSQRCHFVGQRPHAEVPLWLAAADCLVLPSLSEGLPTIVIEAMMCGTPVIATSVGGTPEVLKHERNGLLVPPKDVPAIGSAIARLLGDRGLRVETGLRARIDAENFTWDKNAEITWGQYRELMDRAPQPANQ
jgi:teichuronic acid biosynthesis glycosyltransferase TuaC